MFPPQLPASEEGLSTMLELIANDIEVGHYRGKSLTMAQFNYFPLAGAPEELWEPVLFARMAWEGFFTITTGDNPETGQRLKDPVPLPELQPFYSVIEFQWFEAAKHVRKTLRSLSAGGKLEAKAGRYTLRCNSD